MPVEVGKIRRSQAVTTFGPGSIVDLRSGAKGGGPVSVVAAGLDDWDTLTPAPGVRNTQAIFEPRLQKILSVKGFRLAPVEPANGPEDEQLSSGKLGGYRFPEWLQCPVCNELKFASAWSQDPGDSAKYCAHCSDEAGERVFAVPVRFVVACRSGHLDEFPWNIWVQHLPDCKSQRLKLVSKGGTGLASLFIECSTCKQRRSMEDAFRANALDPLRCRGRRPWLPEDDPQCGERLHVCQRGASNLYYANVCSSLDIPPWSDSLQQALGADWERISVMEPTKRREFIKLVELDAELGIDIEELLQGIATRLGELDSYDASRLRFDEYQALRKGTSGKDQNKEFDVRCESVPPDVQPWFDCFARAVRLREVRALCNFTRIDPPSSWDDPAPGKFAPLSAKTKDWLPAVEVRGEGIFIALSHDKLAEWEQSVRSRIQGLHERFKAQWQERTKRTDEPPRTITPRLVLLHSLAHAVIKQLSLECGYSSSSLRERLYAAEGDRAMAGFLIYTASADADGTLGGLVREGRAERLANVIRGAIRTSRWCSSDPLCISSVLSLSDDSNLAACHCCCMIAETSCEEFNRFLDRATLVGLPDDPDIGFFRDFPL